MENIIFLEPRSTYDAMIIGVCYTIGFVCLSYDKDKIILHLKEEILSEDANVSEEDANIMAIEFFEFNILGAYMGEGSPVYISKTDLEDVVDSSAL